MKGRGRHSGDRLKRDIEMIRDTWFKEHKVRLHTHAWKWPSDGLGIENKVSVMEWRNPATWNYAVRYVIWSNTLYISGDLGEAVHQWSQNVTFQWIAGCDLHYYAEKCQASESGRNFVDWDPDLLVKYLNEQDARELPCVPELLKEASNYGGNHEEWSAWLHSAYQDGTVDDIDTEYLIAISSAGYSVARRCIAHWLGIKMAVEQMNADRQEKVSC